MKTCLRLTILCLLLALAASRVCAQTSSPFTVLSNNADTANNFLYVELMYEKAECRDYEARFFRTSASNPNDTVPVPVVEFLNNASTFETDDANLSLKRPTAGGYRLKFALPDVENPTDSGYRICVKAYTLAYKCVGCAAGGSDAIFADADIDKDCPYAESMRKAGNATLLACYRRESREGNWEAWIQDQRDCKPYRVVAMPDGRWWFAQNLNYQKDLTMYSASNTGPMSTLSAADGGFWCSGGKSFDGSKVSYAPAATPSNPSQQSGGAVACATYGALYSWTTANSLNGRGTLGAQPNVGVTSAVQGICPSGWYLPSDYDWGVMLNAVEGCGNPNAASTVVPCNHVRSDMTTGYMGSPTSKAALKNTRSCPPHSGKADTLCATTDNPSWNWRRADYNGRITTPLALGNDRYGFAALPAGYRLGNGSNFDQTGVRAAFWAAGQNGNNGFSRSLVNIDKNVERGTYAKQHGMSIRCVGAEPLNEFFVFPYGNANTLMLNTDASLLLTCSDGYTGYNWTVTPADGISYTSTNNNSLTITNTSGSLTVGQKYTVTVTANKGGDSFVASKTIEITALPPVELPSLGLAGIYTSPNTSADKNVALTLSAYSSVQPTGATYTWTARANTAGAPAWNLGNTAVPVLNTTTPTISGISSYTLSVTMSAAGYKTASTSIEYAVRGCDPISAGTLADATVCPGASHTLTPTAPSGGDGSTYAYQWQSRTTTSLWGNATGASTGATYTATPTASSVTFYRRTVTSCGTAVYGNEAKLATYSKPSQRASVTAKYICPNTAYKLDNLTVIGGNGTNSYVWQYYQLTPTASTAWTNSTAASKNDAIYDHSSGYAQGHSYNFRRIVTSCGISDTSAAIFVSMIPTVAAGAIAAPGSCGTGNLTLTNSTAASSSWGTPTYQWMSSATTNGTYANATAASGNNTSATIVVPANSTLYYRRVAKICGTVTATAPSATTGLLITQNNIVPTQKTFTQQNVCPGASVTIDLGAATGGNGSSYTYTWQWSTNGVTYTAFSATGVVGNVTVTSFSTTKIVFTAPNTANAYSPYFRRVVASCGTLTPSGVRGAYTNGGITQSGLKTYTLCAGADTMTNLAASGSCGALSYKWEKFNFNTSAYEAVTGGTVANIRVAAPDGSSPDAYNLYRRTVTSGTSTHAYEVTVNKVIFATPITQPVPANLDACAGAQATVSLGIATGGSGAFTYRWQSSTDYAAWTNVPDAAGQNLQVTPAAAGSSVHYRRVATSCGQSNSSTPMTLSAVGSDIFAGVVQERFDVSKNTTVQLRPSDPTGGIGYAYQWQSSADGETWADVSAATTAVYSTAAPATNGSFSPYYRRAVTSCGATAYSNATRIFVSLDCPYKGTDLVAGSCRIRGKWDAYSGVEQAQADRAGVENWEAQITDSRDNKIYRIVQMPDGQWWFAQNVNYQKDLTYQANAAQPTKLDENLDMLRGQFWCPASNNSSTDGTAPNATSTLASCETYGAMYSWVTVAALDGTDEPQSSSAVPSGVRGICPIGWHVPSRGEWELMYAAVGTNVGHKLKSVPMCATGVINCSTDAEPLWSYHATNYGRDTYGFSALPNGYRDYGGGYMRERGTTAHFCTSQENAFVRFFRTYLGYTSATYSDWNAQFKSQARGARCVADYDLTGVSYPSTAPTTIEPTFIAVSVGTPTTLTATGGTLGTNGKYQWSTNSSFSPLLGSDSATLTAEPTVATTYYVRRVDNGTTFTASTSITISIEDCPYAGADMVTNTCGKRFKGNNWQVNIEDGVDNEVYRVVQGPTLDRWYFTEPLRRGTNCCILGDCKKYGAGQNLTTYMTVCPTGWRTPYSSDWAYWEKLAELDVRHLLPRSFIGYGVGGYGYDTWGITSDIPVAQCGDPAFREGATVMWSCTANGQEVIWYNNSAWINANGTLKLNYYECGSCIELGVSPNPQDFSSTYSSEPIRCVRDGITVPEKSTAPQAIEATYIAVRSGKNTTLTAKGSTLGANGVYQWGTGSTVGQNIIASKTTVSITHAITGETAFWVRCVDNGTEYTDAATTTIALATDCPYKGADNVLDSCRRRGVKAANWETYIKDTRDNELYRIVYMPDNSWWLAQNLKYAGNGAIAVPNCSKDDCGLSYTTIAMVSNGFATTGEVQGICPAGWLLPTLENGSWWGNANRSLNNDTYEWQTSTWGRLIMAMGGNTQESVNRLVPLNYTRATDYYGWASKYGTVNGGLTATGVIGANAYFYAHDRGREDALQIDAIAYYNVGEMGASASNGNIAAIRCFRKP